MTVNSIGSASNPYLNVNAQPPVAAKGDQDGDNDQSGAAAAPRPTTNSVGQTIGTLVNTTA